jgi:ElaB/YqjD/DUF883 family membrane-anchored ribosome-binding protein
MGEVPSAGSAPVSQGQSPEEIREQIAETRRELGETVEALSAKTDVKAQAKAQLEETKANLTQKAQDAKATVTETTTGLLDKAKDVSPESAVAAAQAGQEKVRQNPVPAAVAAAFVLGLLLGRLSRR